jgi:carbon-monoxide dehydrogenase medium subunit/putative selenate reductase FAD-binding subunit
MATVSGYERPVTIEAALDELRAPTAVVLGGGTRLNAAPTAEPVLLVDLQSLGLDRIAPTGMRTLSVGAGATLQSLVDAPDVPQAVREAARRELPSTLRAAATVGGCVAVAEADSELFASLLVYDAVVHTATGVVAPLADGPPFAGDFVTAVELATEGSCAWARTGRTRADRPIVSAFARRPPGRPPCLALAGVAARPVLVDDLDALDPPADFRGSADYRRALARTLAHRVLEQVS